MYIVIGELNLSKLIPSGCNRKYATAHHKNKSCFTAAVLNYENTGSSKEPTCLTFHLCGFHTQWRIIKCARVTTNIQASVCKYGVGLRQLSVLYVNNVVILLRTDTSLRQAINVRHYYLLGMNLPRWSDLLCVRRLNYFVLFGLIGRYVGKIMNYDRFGRVCDTFSMPAYTHHVEH